MNLPFTKESFLQLFVLYNTSIWPAQIILNLLALAVIWLILRKAKDSGKTIPAFLALLWLYTGVVYHIIFFTSINPAAWGFGGLFIVQALIFAWVAYKGETIFVFNNSLRSYAGIGVIAYALLIYPLLGYLAGHGYPASPTFGAPCPATIFTFGVLIMAKRPPKYIFILPVAWALIGFTAAFKLGIPEDTGLPLSALLAVVLLFVKQEVEPGPSVNK